MALCHEVVENSIDVKYALGKGVKPDDLRIDPIDATDVDNNSYFFFSAFTVTNFILYREVRGAPPTPLCGLTTLTAGCV